MQNRYSLTYREEEREMNAYCAFAGIGTIPWGPLNAGQLARPYTASQEQPTTRGEADKKMPWYQPDKSFEGEIVGRVEKLAKEKGWTMGQVALAWVNGKVTSPIVGFSSVNYLACRCRRITCSDHITLCRSSAWKRRSFQDTRLRRRRLSIWRSRKRLACYKTRDAD
jgi:hypothetical protein